MFDVLVAQYSFFLLLRETVFSSCISFTRKKQKCFVDWFLVRTTSMTRMISTDVGSHQWNKINMLYRKERRHMLCFNNKNTRPNRLWKIRIPSSSKDDSDDHNLCTVLHKIHPYIPQPCFSYPYNKERNTTYT
jgi:hypothetical protein